MTGTGICSCSRSAAIPTMPSTRFAVLDTVREVAAGGVAATLSIGVGRDADSFDALFKNASLALEMALSRGGDQAVVKDRLNFQFYGGRAKSTEKRTKVKSRVMANALGELMDDARQVYVMGHSYADMDSLGAAAGVCCIARKRGKQVPDRHRHREQRRPPHPAQAGGAAGVSRAPSSPAARRF